MTSFTKICATGNDFLLLDLLDQKDFVMPAENLKLEIPKWCHRQKGFGADGFVVIKPHSMQDFQWVFYNSDGNEAELCGNAARAVSRYYALKTGISKFTFLTKVGSVEALVNNPSALNDTVTVTLPKWTQFENMKDPVEGEFQLINTGVPHVVLAWPSITDRSMMKAKALKIKALGPFQKSGVNVTFRTQTPTAKGNISSVTYERGVENFTLSCGTGAIASAISTAKGAESFKIVVEVPGGMLTVEAHGGKVHLTGEATVIGTCTLGVKK